MTLQSPRPEGCLRSIVLDEEHGNEINRDNHNDAAENIAVMFGLGSEMISGSYRNFTEALDTFKIISVA